MKFEFEFTFEQLENLGWDFSDLYNGSANEEKTAAQVEAELKENFFIRIWNNGSKYLWAVADNGGTYGDPQETGDDEKTESDIKILTFLYKNLQK